MQSNFPKTVYLNRDIDTDRRVATESQLEEFRVQATRFAAIEDGLENLVKQSAAELRINRAQLSCLISHLEILRANSSNDLLVLEDDVDLSNIPNWTVSLSEVADSLPSSVGVVQLTYFPTRGTLLPVHWVPGTFSTAAYFIKKEYAQHLVSLGFSDGKWDIPKLRSGYVQPLADSIIYSSTNTMSLLMFGVRDEVSTILPHATYSQEASKWAKEMWETNAISKEELLQYIRNFK